MTNVFSVRQRLNEPLRGSIRANIVLIYSETKKVLLSLPTYVNKAAFTLHTRIKSSDHIYLLDGSLPSLSLSLYIYVQTDLYIKDVNSVTMI